MIELQQVNKTYSYKKANAVHALVDVSLRINEGELTAIVGKSGSGKTVNKRLPANPPDRPNS